MVTLTDTTSHHSLGLVLEFLQRVLVLLVQVLERTYIYRIRTIDTRKDINFKDDLYPFFFSLYTYIRNRSHRVSEWVNHMTYLFVGSECEKDVV